MSPPLLVACLCAAWCGTCTAYAQTFENVARQHADARFVWIDIEEHSDALGEAPDLEDFPTLLITRGDELCFFGTVLPHEGTLARTVQAAASGSLRMAGAPEHLDLAAAVRELAPSLPAV